MARQPSGSAALLITFHSDKEASGRWYARVVSYDDSMSSDMMRKCLDSTDEVCATVRTWIQRVVHDAEDHKAAST